MNRFQLVVVVIAAVNILLMLLFPPFLNDPIGLMVPKGFDGFYFFFAAAPGRQIHSVLLNIEVLFVLANALAAWLALASPRRLRPGPDRSQARITAGVALFGLVDFAVIGLFPPFEPYQSLVRVPPVGFEGFYFLLGDKMHRPIFTPLLYLEFILVAVNLLSAWLLLGIVGRRLTVVDEELLELAHHLPPEKLAVLEESLREEAKPAPPHEETIGRHGDRRHHPDPDYHGAERRAGIDRRHRG